MGAVLKGCSLVIEVDWLELEIEVDWLELEIEVNMAW